MAATSQGLGGCHAFDDACVTGGLGGVANDGRGAGGIDQSDGARPQLRFVPERQREASPTDSGPVENDPE